MKHLLRGLLLACVTVGSADAVLAQQVAPADAREIRQVIELQLDAFASDDAERAFAYASPAIRQQFGSPERFIEMVRRGYRMIYRPASVVFLRAEPEEAEVRQEVQIQDATGAPWMARYRMQRQTDRSWRINGVAISRIGSRAI